MQAALPRSQPWLRPSPGSIELPQDTFTLRTFMHPDTGDVYARSSLRLFGKNASRYHRRQADRQATDAGSIARVGRLPVRHTLHYTPRPWPPVYDR